MDTKERTRQSDMSAKREYLQSLRRAKKLAKGQRIEFTLEETILIVHAFRLALDTRNIDEIRAYVHAMPMDLLNRFNKAPKEQIDDLRSYARAS